MAGSANHDERRYKRKSTAQVRRDKERSAAWRNERSTPTHNADTVPQCSGGVSVGANAGDSQTFGVRTRSQKLHDQEEADVEQPRCAAYSNSPAPVMDITLPSPDISSSILNPSAECFTLDISHRTPVMSPLSRDGEQTYGGPEGQFCCARTSCCCARMYLLLRTNELLLRTDVPAAARE